MTNLLGMRGIAFVEFASAAPEALERIFTSFGMSRTHRHKSLPIDLYRQHDIRFFVNRSEDSHAARFQRAHGPSISALGFRFDDANAAFAEAVRRGARPVPALLTSFDAPAIYGIGDSAIYFVDARRGVDGEMVALDNPTLVPEKGFLSIDHLTNNVEKGSLHVWSDFYKRVFGFTEVRAFDIEGKKTGLYSFALRSPCGSFCIPINEDKGATGQIAEYLAEYRGPGVQHLAFLTRDILSSLEKMNGEIPMLDIDASYYEEAFQRVPTVREDRSTIMKRQVLVDGDEKGYLLQIFTKNLVGPIFIELIQRENHLSFGEGNFSALFRSIERDQEKRGTI